MFPPSPLSSKLRRYGAFAAPVLCTIFEKALPSFDSSSSSRIRPPSSRRIRSQSIMCASVLTSTAAVASSSTNIFDEQKILQLYGEIDMHKRDKDELEMQMEQLALDYEILKEENHENGLKAQRAIRAEEALRKNRLKNTNAAGRLQEELKRLSTFDANEKAIMRAYAEASELSHGNNLIATPRHILNTRKSSSSQHNLLYQVVPMF
ncbi:hypothetical protein K1719_043682 [Acacia pycnantha]|nr:hypothetical protein K1719_043682 [Acacia pycnantha]